MKTLHKSPCEERPHGTRQASPPIAYRAAISLAILLLTLAPACTSPEAERMDTFNEVCRTISQEFYDPEFGGHDWAVIVEQYKPRIEKAKDDEQFFVLMNQMLFELGVSHLGLIPDEHPEWIGAPAVFADGGVGIDVRLHVS